MVFDRLANLLSPKVTQQLVNRGNGAGIPDFGNIKYAQGKAAVVQDEEETRPPYLHATLAGGFGGTTGDMLMHSLDTVKTRQQGDPHIPPRYTSLGSTYHTIWRQEGILRGLYGGVTPAFLGSFSGTCTFFLSYEYSKRKLLDAGMNPALAYLSAGFVADLAASPVYVPSEVLKTRLQLQGRYNNPYFQSGYNYRSTWNATKNIIRIEGFPALFSGYKATLARDLPFSALQFAFYEQNQQWAKDWVGSKAIGLPLEVLTAVSAGGLAGVLTCPLDVVKTRLQTQVDPSAQRPSRHPVSRPRTSSPRPLPAVVNSPSKTQRGTLTRLQQHNRPIFTSSSSASVRNPGSVLLNTSSISTGLRIIYQTEGIAGWFRGVGPRGLWSSIQSGTMLVLYQAILRYFERHPLVGLADQ